MMKLDDDDAVLFLSEAPAPAKREATAEAGFVTTSKAQKVPKPLSREYLNTQKKLPEFMLKETDPIKRMKYKTGTSSTDRLCDCVLIIPNNKAI